MTSIRLEKTRECYAQTDQERIAKLMTCPFLEEELGGVQERGVRLSVQKLAKNSKIPKAILFANAALSKELRKQQTLLESAKHHRLIVLSWNQRQFFLRQMFDAQNNFRFVTRKVSPAEDDTDAHANEGGSIPGYFTPMFDCFATKMTKSVQTHPRDSKQSHCRASSVSICETPIANPVRRRHVYSAPPRSGRRAGSHSLASGQSACPIGVSHKPVKQLPNWYSCLTTKPWMLPSKGDPTRIKSAHSAVTSQRPSSTLTRGRCPDNGCVSHAPSGHTESTSDVVNSRNPLICRSMRTWSSAKNRTILKRILPSLPDKALQKMLDLFGEDIEEQKRFLQTMSKSLANRNALKDKRWRNLEATLTSLQPK